MKRILMILMIAMAGISHAQNVVRMEPLPNKAALSPEQLADARIQAEIKAKEYCGIMAKKDPKANMYVSEFSDCVNAMYAFLMEENYAQR